MNTDLFIYDKLPRKANFGSNIEANTRIFIHTSLLKHPSWVTYNRGYLIRYFGVLDFLLEMAFITNLAYTYRNSGQEVYQISPYYIQSLYQAMDWRSCSKDFDHQYRRTSHVLRTSRMMKDYLVMEERGHLTKNPETNRRAFIYTKYRVTDALKKLAASLTEDNLWEVELQEIVERSNNREPLKTMKNMLYIVKDKVGNELEFSTLKTAREYAKENECSTPELVQTPNRLVRMNVISKQSYDEVHKGVVRHKTLEVVQKSVSTTSTITVNRDEIKKIIFNPSSGNDYSAYVLSELIRMYDETTNENPTIELKYFQSKQGRHYVQNSAAQLFPKELRERIFSEYVAVDMECSIFSLYKNLGKKYGYKKPTPQMDEIIKNRRAYRERFVSPRLPYEGVKTILTAIAYGAIVDVYNMYMEINSDYRCRRKSSLLNCGYDKMSVLDMCNSDEIVALVKELRSLGRFIITKSTDKERQCIVNLCGNSLSLKNKKTFGVKMAHIYQSYEAAILMELKNVQVEGFPLGCMDGAIGLYLHDGVYVRKNIAKKYDLCSMFSERIKTVFDFDISYEIE